MRALLVFLLCLAPMTALLAYLDRDERDTVELPNEAAIEEGPPLLLGSDLADAYGQTVFPGSVRRLEGLELRAVEEGYFRLYLHVARLGRHEGTPRLEEVRAVVFDPPREGKPNRRLTFHAPFVWGDPRELLHAAEGAPRKVTLDGGVQAFDAGGRPIAEVPRLSIDLGSKRVTTDFALVLRMPERDAEVRAAGLDADLGLKTARLKGPLLASLGASEGPFTLRAAAGATLNETPDTGEVTVEIEGGVEIARGAALANGERLDATLKREEGKLSLVRATLRGRVRLALAGDMLGGLESIEMPKLVIEGEDRVSCEGPVEATWKGPLPESARRVLRALGERTVKIRADSASFRLGRGEDGRLVVQEARFEGFRAEDDAGAGSLAGRSAVYALEGGSLVVEGPVEVSAPVGSLTADGLRLVTPEKGSYDLVIEGRKKIAYRAEGALPALGDPGQGPLRLTSKGPLELRARGDRLSCEGSGDVLVSTDAGASLRCDHLALEVLEKAVSSLVATGSVTVLDPARGAEIRGDRVSYGSGATTVNGQPASLSMKDGRTVRAPRITLREDRSFEASGGVGAELPLSEKGTGFWRLACGEASGVLSEKGAPASLRATGVVRGEGPAGEGFLGDSLDYDGEKGLVTLRGKPARVRRGEEMELVAPEGLTLRIEGDRVAEGSSLGPAAIDYRPKPSADGSPANAFRSWRAELKGPARFDGNRVVVDKGATLFGSDGTRDALVAEARRVEILLEVGEKAITVKEIVGSGGVKIDAKEKEPMRVTAQRLSYAAGSSEVRVSGDAQVVAKGWPGDVKFRELLFALTKDGIDLKRASDVEVRGK